MLAHDPRREVEKLRELLASHDKPIALLIGAGASCAVRDAAGDPLVPAIAALTERCAARVRDMPDPYPDAYVAVEAEVRAATTLNIEEILSSIRRKTRAVGENDRLVGLSREQLTELERTIQATIASAAQPAEHRIPGELPHHALARWLGRADRMHPVEIFTPNYDTLIERALEDERVPVFDGFVGSRRPFFSPASLIRPEMAPGARWARLWKVHGSINWSWQHFEGRPPRIVRGEETAGGELIFPSFEKYDESRKQPYVAMLDRLQRVLTAHEDTVLVTCGYSFGDQHINAVIFEALEARERVHACALQFGDFSDDHELIRRAKRNSNLLVYGPTSAVVGGVRGEWRLVEPVDETTSGLLDVPFDSDAAPEADTHALTGRFRLGDFLWLACFLDSIAGDG